MWAVIFCALSATACVICMVSAIFAARTAARRSESPRAAIRSCELRLQSLEDSRTETTQLLADLANRLKMMRVRSASRHAEDSQAGPDPFRNPNEWRTMMNRKIAQSKLGGNV